MTLVFAGLVAILYLQGPEVGAVRDRLDAYLLAYEVQLGALVAEERFVQQVSPWDPTEVNRTGPPRRISRSLVSEIAFIGLPGNAGWMGFRRVVKVDGKMLKDAGPSMEQTLTDEARDDLDQARLLLSEGARYNLGAERTTNLPALPLEFLHPRRRDQFSGRIDGRETVGGRATVRLVLEEVSRPTIIQRPGGGDVPSRVTAWVEPTTGQLLRAEVRTHDARADVPTSDTLLRVEFKREAALGLLVPAEMHEEFFAGRTRRGHGRATYAKYRRFQTIQ